MMEINPALLGYQIVVFLIFLYLMYRFVYKRVFRILEKRQDKIEGDINEAEKNRLEMERLREEYQRKMSQVGEESDRILREAEREANQRRNDLIMAAKEDAGTIIERAERRIAEEEEKASAEIRRRTVEISLSIAEKLLKEKIDERKDKALAEKFLAEVEDVRWKTE